MKADKLSNPCICYKRAVPHNASAADNLLAQIERNGAGKTDKDAADRLFNYTIGKNICLKNL